MRVRQLCLVAAEFAPATAQIGDILGLNVCINDPNVGVFGLENAVWSLGDDFLEVVAPVRDGTAAGRYLERRHGDGGYMVILQSNDALAQRRRLVDMGVRAVWEIDREKYVATHFHPRDTGGFLLSIDSTDAGAGYAEDLSSWSPAGENWQQSARRDVVSALTAIELQADDPLALAELWSKLLQLPLSRGDDAGHPTMAFENCSARFVPASDGRGAGLGGLDVKVADLDHVRAQAAAHGVSIEDECLSICGTRFYLT